MSLPQKNLPWAIGGLIVLVVALTLWTMHPGSTPSPAPTDGNAQSTKPPVQSVAQPDVPQAPITVHQSAGELGEQVLRAGQSTEDRLQAVGQVLYVYRQGFGGNPTGQNEDVVAALTGENAKRTALLPKDFPAIKEGKLVDEWGTPYWFHSVSNNQTEIRSAGPDKELFTNDDVFIQ
ncbi:MAG: hypothetical protein ACAI34_15385 [Verrucomicrobium sp.]